VPPRTTVELELVRIWEELLQVRPIGVRDDFFGIGGHSLLAVRMAAFIEKRLGSSLPLARLFTAGTIEAIAAELDSLRGAGSGSPVVALKATGARPPLFCVHPAGGGAFCYLALSRAVGQDQPFYAFQAPGLDDGQMPQESVEALASFYLEAVRRVQPTGPYHLGGWSFGGLVAFEMARRIVAQGEEVASLVLIDTHLRDPSGAGTFDPIALLSSAARQEGFPVDEKQLRTLGIDGAVAQVAQAATTAGLLPLGLGERYVRRILAVHEASINATNRYVPSTYSRRLTLLRATGRDAGSPDATRRDPTLGWSHLVTGGVRVIDVPGSHDDLLRAPYVENVAAAVRAILAEFSHDAADDE
jgi:thioesterase domain-containing protein